MYRFLAVCSLTLASIGDAHACSCVGHGPIQDSYTSYDHIFVARIIGGSIAIDTDTGREVVVATYEVREVLKGEAGDVSITANAFGNNLDNCSVQLLIGAHYLIFVDSSKSVHLHLCHISGRPITYSNAVVDNSVEIMRKMAGKSAP